MGGGGGSTRHITMNSAFHLLSAYLNEISTNTHSHVIPQMLASANQQLIEEQFRQSDSDHDGKLTEDQLVKLLPAIGRLMS